MGDPERRRKKRGLRSGSLNMFMEFGWGEWVWIESGKWWGKVRGGKNRRSSVNTSS